MRYLQGEGLLIGSQGKQSRSTTQSRIASMDFGHH